MHGCSQHPDPRLPGLRAGCWCWDSGLGHCCGTAQGDKPRPPVHTYYSPCVSVHLQPPPQHTLLMQVGIPVTVLEREGGPRREGSAIGLWPNAFRALDALGVAEPLRAAHPLFDRCLFPPCFAVSTVFEQFCPACSHAVCAWGTATQRAGRHAAEQGVHGGPGSSCAGRTAAACAR